MRVITMQHLQIDKFPPRRSPVQIAYTNVQDEERIPPFKS